MLSGYQFILGGIVMAVCGFFMGGHLSGFTLPAFAMLFYLAVISAVAYSLWGLLLKYNPISKVAVFGFMNPVFGVMLSALLLSVCFYPLSCLAKKILWALAVLPHWFLYVSAFILSIKRRRNPHNL